MNLFYTPDIDSDIYSLNEEESRHCRLVLRLREGDPVHLTNGKGTMFESRILDSRSKLVTVEIVSRTDNYNRRDYRLHMAVAPTKNIDRFEWFLEKATEIGVDEFTPLLCEHSERRQIRTDRLFKVITSAVKQSLKAYHPVLNEMTDFNEFISRERQGGKYIAHLEENDPVLLKEVFEKTQEVTILIGPEGDFSSGEISKGIKQGYLCVSLGNSRLRTETAAIAAIHTIFLLNS
jgi:16S rRNA (uracil1498-N3)-methyltransferase